MTSLPAPGTSEAKALGCLCPNTHEQARRKTRVRFGYAVPKEPDEYEIANNCPVHCINIIVGHKSVLAKSHKDIHANHFFWGHVPNLTLEEVKTFRQINGRLNFSHIWTHADALPQGEEIIADRLFREDRQRREAEKAAGRCSTLERRW